MGGAVTPRDPIIVTLAKRRTDLRISQMEVATRLGTYPANVWRCEAGETMPRLDTLRRWADALGVRIEVAQ